MSKREFKVGDKVRIRQWDDMAKEFEITPIGDIRPSFTLTVFNRNMRELCGRIAKITYICDDTVKLDFDDKLGCVHWNYKTWMIEPLKNESIVIYRKGQEVIALDKTTGKKAIAKCCPDDEFDFNTGAKLAFERLLGVEQPKEDDGFCHKFKDGKTYVFRKSLHDKRYSSSSSWCRKCDGKIVTVEDCSIGNIEGWRISPEWCEEIDLAIGDTVEVINIGNNYSTFDEWKGLKEFKQNYVKHSQPKYNKKYKVLNIKEHGGKFDDGRILVLIQDPDTTQVFIINTRGIKKA